MYYDLIEFVCAIIDGVAGLLVIADYVSVRVKKRKKNARPVDQTEQAE